MGWQLLLLWEPWCQVFPEQCQREPFFLSLLPSGTEVQERELHSQFSLSQPALHNFPSEARLLSHEQLVLMTSDRGSRTGIPVRSVVKITQSCLTLCYPPHGLYSPWNSLGENTGMGSLSLLQGIFPTQGLNPGLQ